MKKNKTTNWAFWYFMVLLALLLQILFYYLFTEYYNE